MTDAPRITPEMLHLIAQLDEAKGQWQALRTLVPDRLRALRHSATIESIGSSTRIEGVKLSNHEVERLLHEGLLIGQGSGRSVHYTKR